MSSHFKELANKWIGCLLSGRGLHGNLHWRKVWSQVIEYQRSEGERLQAGYEQIISYTVKSPFAEVLRYLKNAIHILMERLSTTTRLMDTASTARSCVQKEKLRIGIGNPSNLGFSDRSGTVDNFASLQDKRFGVIAACQYLNLDIIGLPGARVRMPKTVPLPKGFSMASKGGSAYASAAAIWSQGAGVQVRPRDDWSSGRQQWLMLEFSGEEPIKLGILQFPPAADAARDQEWSAELAKLETALELINAESGRDKLQRVLLAGDINLQPDELGGG